MWDDTLVAEGFSCLERADVGTNVTRYHVEAAIAACHVVAPTYAGARAGLEELDTIPEREVLARYRYTLASYAELHTSLHTSLGNLDEARSYLDRALEHQSSTAQAALLRRKRAALDR
ncbi:MAG: hypothetical protein ABI035_03935 [Gemmatimonadaceae bacterium]